MRALPNQMFESGQSTKGGACAARQLHPQLQNVPADESHRGLVPIPDIDATRDQSVAVAE